MKKLNVIFSYPPPLFTPLYWGRSFTQSDKRNLQHIQKYHCLLVLENISDEIQSNIVSIWQEVYEVRMSVNEERLYRNV